MRRVLLGAAVVALLAGCTGIYQGPSRGIVGAFDWKGFSGVNTTARTGEVPMGYRKGADGSVEEMYGTWTPDSATGIPAHLMAEAYLYEKKMMLCLAAPKTKECVAGASSEPLAPDGYPPVR